MRPRSSTMTTPSLSTSRTASIWVSHSGFSILIESPVVTDISCPEQKKRVEATDSRERHFWRRDLGGPCGKGLKIRPSDRNAKQSACLSARQFVVVSHRE